MELTLCIFYNGLGARHYPTEDMLQHHEKRHLKDLVSPHLVQYIDNGTYWLHELGDNSYYLEKNQYDYLK